MRHTSFLAAAPSLLPSILLLLPPIRPIHPRTHSHLPTHLLLPAVTADAIVGTFGATRQYLCTATNTGWELGRAPNSELVAVQCVPGQDCLHSAQQLHGYLPVAKHPPIRQLPVSSDQKSEGSEGRYGLLGTWHPGLLGPRVGGCEGMAGPSCLLSILPQKSGVEATHF